MTQIVIIIDEEGKFETALTDSEVSCKVLRRGVNDNEIDEAECNLEELN